MTSKISQLPVSRDIPIPHKSISASVRPKDVAQALPEKDFVDAKDAFDGGDQVREKNIPIFLLLCVTTGL